MFEAEVIVELGVQGLNTRVAMGGRETARLARLAERLGYGSWWAADHVVLPTPALPGSSQDPIDPIHDPLVNLAYVAAVTEKLDLGTGIVILPQRNPVILAKQAASLDVLSGGRLLLGVGVGWLEPEMTAIGVSMSDRGARADEYLDAMTALWVDPARAYESAADGSGPPSGTRVTTFGWGGAWAQRRAVRRADRDRLRTGTSQGPQGSRVLFDWQRPG